MHITRYLMLRAVLAAVVVATIAPMLFAQSKDQADLIAVLESDAPKAEKAITCKYLAIYGDKKAVPALAPLLADEELSSWALIALEAIPGEEADAALRDGLDRLEGRELLGVINAIAVRKDAGAVEQLTDLLDSPDSMVVSCVGPALGQIGTAEAIATLLSAIKSDSSDVRAATAEGCTLAADRLLLEGSMKESAILFDAVLKSDVPKQRHVEATRGAILSGESNGIPLLIELLQSDDKAYFRLGMTVAREIEGSDATKAIADALKGMPADRQALLLTALADRGDAVVLPAVLDLLKDGSDDVRPVAVSVISQLGDVTCVPVLLDVAVQGDEQLAGSALTALKALQGEDVDADIVARLADAQGATRTALMNVVAQRRIAAAVPLLLEDVDDRNAETRAAALTALGETVGPDQLTVLIDAMLSSRSDEDAAIAQKALRTAAVRMPDREATAKQLVDAISDTNTDVLEYCALLEILGAMEGDTALTALRAAGLSSYNELQDTATRLLGGWMTVDAAPVLLELAKSAPNPSYRIRSMRGYIRLVRQFPMPDADRVAMCRTALETAQRDAEKLLVLEVIERYPSIDMLRLATETAKTPSLKEAANRSAMAVAQQIAGKGVKLETLLGMIGQEPLEIEIIKAEYGSGATYKDVTGVLKKHVTGLPLIALPSASYNSAFGGDPTPGEYKQLKIQYRINGKDGQVELKENAPVMLPMPK